MPGEAEAHRATEGVTQPGTGSGRAGERGWDWSQGRQEAQRSPSEHGVVWTFGEKTEWRFSVVAFPPRAVFINSK